MKAPFFFLLLLLAVCGRPTALRSQCIPFDDCGNVDCLFDTLSFAGLNGSLLGYTPTSPMPNFCGSLESDIWLPFVPADTLVEFTIVSTNCWLGNGLQGALYTDCAGQPLDCYPGISGAANVPVELSAPVTPGQLYYLMIDGYGGDQCDFTIAYSGGSLGTSLWELYAYVVFDENANCAIDSGERRAVDLTVVRNQYYQRPTDSLGVAYFRYGGGAPFEVSLPLLDQTDLWTACQTSFTVTPSSQPSADTVVFFLQPLQLCPQLEVGLSFPALLRSCWIYPLSIPYFNEGTDTAHNAELRLLLPPVLSVNNFSPSPTAQSGDTLIFSLGDLAPLQAGRVTAIATMTCNTDSLGWTFCAEAEIFPQTLCSPPVGWSGAHVGITADCLADTLVRFTLANVGTGAMAQALEYRLIKNDSTVYVDAFQLAAGETLLIERPADGATWRLEAEQEALFPGLDLPGVSIEGCGGLTPGFVNIFPANDRARSIDIACAPFVGSYDPNLKAALPSGAGPDHLLRANTPINYVIQFENTGTDTAFLVVLVDTLPTTLDPSTFAVTGGSHPYTWRLDGQRLEVTYANILLPYTGIDSVGSHGWFSFTVDQQPDLLDGTLLTNSAAIYFDFNPPVITDPAWHTVGEPIVLNAPNLTTLPRAWRVLTGIQGWYLQADGHAPRQTRLDLYDAAGRLARTTTFDGTAYALAGVNMAPGVYFLQLRSDNGITFAGKLLWRG